MQGLRSNEQGFQMFVAVLSHHVSETFWITLNLGKIMGWLSIKVDQNQSLFHQSKSLIRIDWKLLCFITLASGQTSHFHWDSNDAFVLVEKMRTFATCDVSEPVQRNLLNSSSGRSWASLEASLCFASTSLKTSPLCVAILALETNFVQQILFLYVTFLKNFANVMPDEAGKSDQTSKAFKFIYVLICDTVALRKEQNSFRFISELI